MQRRVAEKARRKQDTEAKEAIENEVTKQPQRPALDWPNITVEDFDKKVEPYLAELGDATKQIFELRRLQAEFNEAAENHLATFYEIIHHPFFRWRNVAVRGKPHEFTARRDAFNQRLQSKLKMLTALLVIEQDEEALKSQGAKKNEPRRGKPLFTTAQCCLVIHYLLHEAEYKGSYGDRDTAPQRLISALTGYDIETVRKMLPRMFSRRKQTPDDLKKVKPYFEALGLQKIVDHIETAPVGGDGDDDDDDYS